MRALRRSIGFLCVGVLGLATSAAPPADATFPGHDGGITFSRVDENGNFQVWVANADLTDQHQLTAGDSGSGFSTWKPDGTRLAFDSDRSDPDRTDDVGINDVFTMNPDGTGVVQVTDGSGFSGDPSWSPSGRLLTFESDLGDNPAKQGIYLSTPDGRHLRRVTTLPSGDEIDAAPRFSPSGTRIVFTRFHLDTEGVETSALYIVNVDGSHERRLAATADLHPGDADWSPDGETLVFEADGPALSRGDIFTIRADGRHLRNLTNDAPFLQGAADPVFSPDGRQIMYLKGEFPADGEATLGLATMRKNGHQQAFISNTPVEEHQPDWLPVSPRR